MIIYLIPLARNARDACAPCDATIPEDAAPNFSEALADRLSFLCLSCTAWGFSCLAAYASSGELLPRLFTFA